MTNRIYKSIVAVVLLISFVICNCSCNERTAINNEDYWYGCQSFLIPAKEGYTQSVCLNLYSEGYYYVAVYGLKADDKIDGPDNYYQLYKIDADGKLQNEVSLPAKCASHSHQAINGNRLYCTDSNTEYVIDINNGSILSEKPSDTTLGFYSVEDGCVKLTTSSIIHVSSDGEETGHVDLKNADSFRSFYQREGKYYLVMDNSMQLAFYELNFAKKHMEKVLESNVLDYYGLELSDGLFFSNNGIYCPDMKTKSLVPVTEWDYVDVKPAYKNTRYEINISYGEQRFGKLYAYKDNEFELIIFNNIPADVYANRTPITIGGYGVESSLAIKCAAYNFNTSQDKYRIYLEDYWNEYPYASGVEAQGQIAKLIKHFNDGHAPDIYYGTNFDYRYMYNAGLVTNMLPIMENDPDFDIDMLIPSIKDTITENGVCYQIFSAFYFDGDFGLKSTFGDEDVTYSKVAEIAKNTNTSVRGDMHSGEFADQIIRYSLGNLISRTNDKHVMSMEELKSVVEYSVNNGIPYNVYESNIADMDTVHDGTYLTCRRTCLGNLYELNSIESRLNDSFVYLGFPSIYGSVHAAQPDGLVAISSDTKNQDACWLFIKYMLSDEVQEVEIGQGNNPVVNKVFDEFCQYALEPESVPESEVIWKSIVNRKMTVANWVVTDYREMVYSIDIVISYDWGLYNIICEEINSYYIQGKSTDEIAESLQSRIDLYVSENYK